MALSKLEFERAKEISLSTWQLLHSLSLHSPQPIIDLLYFLHLPFPNGKAQQVIEQQFGLLGDDVGGTSTERNTNSKTG